VIKESRGYYVIRESQGYMIRERVDLVQISYLILYLVNIKRANLGGGK